MAWDIVKNMLFVGILYMVIPFLVIGVLWSQLAKWRSSRQPRDRADGLSSRSGEAD